MRLLLVPVAIVLSVAPVAVSQRRPQRAPPLPVTAAEASGFTKTSTLDDLRTFLDAIGELPGGGRLEVTTFGHSREGRDLLLVHVKRDADALLRVLVVANIHGGEVCGKEAVQLILREIAAGEHGELLAACDLWFVPIYNVDGNEKIASSNRSNVNGPVGGLGERANADGLDLNRDCIKVRSPEFLALLSVFGEVDPHVLFDLHTTNGSPHGYHLTYAPSLSTNVDRDIDGYLRAQLLPEVRQATLQRHGYRMFDYGNFGRGDTSTFATFDHRPRFLSNYYGIRNRLSLLSEAYAYEPFEVRVRATRAFVIESLRVLGSDCERVVALCAQADRRCVDGDGDLRFGWDTALIDGDEMDVLTSVWDRVPAEGRGRRTLRRSEVTAQRMRVQNAFVSRAGVQLPLGGWALVAPGDAVLDLLRAHGVEVRRLSAPYDGRVEKFIPRSGDKAARPFQGVRTIALRGEWRTQDRTLAVGTWLVPSHQPLARVAAQLLEPDSEDGMVTWGLFEERTTFAVSDQDEGSFPVMRVPTRTGLKFD